MILPALIALSFRPVIDLKFVETKLFRNQKGKVEAGSIALSPDFEHYSYSSPDHKMIIDGKSYGPFLSNGAVVYSGDSKNFAFLANVKPNAPAAIFLNGVEKPTEFPVTSIFRAGEAGGICWGEHKVIITKDEKDPIKENRQDFTRLVFPGGVTAWFEKIEKIYFSDDGSDFALRTSERIPPTEVDPKNPAAPTSRDFIVHQDGSKVARDQVVQIFPAPSAQGYATLAGSKSSVADYTVSFRGRNSSFKGEFYGKPVFSPDGKQFAYRRSFTGPTPDGRNIPFYQYTIGAFEIPDLQIQTGLTFAPDGKKWVMCGLNGKEPNLYVSSMGMVSYRDFPLMGGAPAEPYKVARFAAGKMVFLFQPKREKPTLFVEDKGLFELGSMTSLPDSLSISPNGRWLVLAAGDVRETRAFLVDLENPGPAIDIMKPGYDLQVLGKGTFVWKNDHEFQFMILRNSDLTRVTATL